MTDNIDDNNNRRDFIKEMYRVYWANMARSMEGVWKVLAPITVTGTILVGVHKEYLPTPIGIALAVAVLMWALNVTIDLNAWHRRNLFFVAKAEHEFLSKQDYGRILPSQYKVPSLHWITFYSISFVAFIVLLILSIIYAIVWKWSYLIACIQIPGIGFVQGGWLPGIVLLVGLVITSLNAWTQEISARKHRDELFNKEDETQVKDSEIIDAE